MHVEHRKKPRSKAAGCFLEHEGRFLIIQRNLEQAQGGKWGLPAGRVEKGETEKSAVVREVSEETGFSIPPGKIEFLQEIIFDFPEKITDFFVYRVNLDSKIEIALDPREHQAYVWITGKECYARDDLIKGLRTTLEKTGYASAGIV